MPHETRKTAHAERMEEEVARILSELSGIDADRLDLDATFLELGFESLSLTQVSLAVKREFGVDLGFRELLESCRTPGTLAGRLTDEVPPEEQASPDQPQPAAVDAAPERAPRTAGAPAQDPALPSFDLDGDALPSASAEGVERIIRRQLRMMNQQLELLASGDGARARTSSSAEPVRDGADVSSEGSWEEPSSDRREAPETAEEPDEAPDAPDDSSEEPHGPWRPMDHSRDDRLTERQGRHIRELVERVEDRMPTSKRLTQENRARLSDPRTVEGFRRAWKEAVLPVVSKRSEGAYVWDVDGNRYVDIAMGFGVALLGHHPPFVREALRERLEEGFAIGPQTPLAGEVAELVHELTGMERVAFCNTGSEAVLAAIRTARTVTGRTRIATFRGDYHGIFDEMLVRGIELGGESRSVPIAPGIPRHAVQAMTLLDYGDESSLERIREEADELAAVLVEPVQSRHPDLQPREFLRKLREVTRELDVPLILDEMITGFRSHPGGIQALWDVDADLATYGKVAGGGMPIGIVTGKKRFLDALDGGYWEYGDDSIPEAGVTWFAGTFVRHPMSLAAARATLEHLKDRGSALQEELNRRTAGFVDELNTRFEEMGASLHVQNFSSLFKVDFLEGTDAESLFYFQLKARGVHVTEGRAAFLSTAHSEADIEYLVEAFTDSVRALQDGGFLPSGERDEEEAARRPDASEPRSVEERVVRVDGRRLRELPLTVGQMEIWLATQVGEDANRSFNLANEVRLEGPMDEDALREAVRIQVARHEALRTTVHAQRADGGDGPVQRVHPVMTVDIPLTALDQMDEADRQERLEELRRREVIEELDLEGGPLFRARLVRLAPDDHLLLFTAHHAVCDGWSCGVLLRNIGETYRALRDGRSPELDEPTQLGDYVRMEHERRTGASGREAEEHWLERLRDDTPVTELPTDRPRPRLKTYGAARVERALGTSLQEEIRETAAARDATTFALLYAAFRVLMHRLTDQDDLVLAISAAGQAMVGARELVGDCVNTLPVRSRIGDAETPFQEHLTATRNLVLDAFDHQECTFGSLIEKLQLERDPGRVPLVSVLFNLDPTLAALDYGEELDVSARSVPRAFEIFDLFFNVVTGADEFRVECTFNTDLLDAETVERWLEAYHEILETVADEPDRPLERLGPSRGALAPRSEAHEAPTSSADPERSGEDSTPHEPTERALAHRWAEVLGTEPSSPDDDFFLLGGHSLLAMRLLSRVEREFGVEMSLGAFLENSTLRDMAREIRIRTNGDTGGPNGANGSSRDEASDHDEPSDDELEEITL